MIGAGVIGRLRARTIRRAAETTLAAVCDVAPQAAREVAGDDIPVHAELEAFLDQPMDAVVVSSPVHFHEEACVAALERGLHVLVEKPLSNTVAGGRQIVEAAHAADRILAVGFNLRYFPSFRLLRDTVVAGTIGEVVHARLLAGHDGLANFRAEWQYRAPESGGGTTMDIGIHLSDLARHVLGDITEVYGVTSEATWQVPGSEDDAIATFRSPTGQAASYHATWIEWQGYRVGMEVYGTHGMVRASYGPMRNLVVTHERPGAPRRRQQRLYPEVMLREKFRGWETTTELAFQEELTDFVARIEGGAGGPLADGHDGLRALEVSEAIRQSSASREAVHLAPLGAMRG